jgi:hypothetical protein
MPIKMRNGVPVTRPDGTPIELEPDDLSALFKVELVMLASSLGAVLDGSETKADLIGIVERQRRVQAQ